MEFVLLAAVVVLVVMMLSTRGRLDEAERRIRDVSDKARDLQFQVTRLKNESRVATSPEPRVVAAAAPRPAPATTPALAGATIPPAGAIPAPTPPLPPSVAPAPVSAPVAKPAPRHSTQPVSEPPARHFDWERLIGVKLFSGVAAVAVVFGAIYFLRIAVERGWLEPPLRVAIGVLVSIGLLLFSERRAAGRYRITANALDAAAVTILYSTFYAAHALWKLFGEEYGGLLTLVLLALVTALAATLSIRRSSMFIAALGLLGGFAAPALLSTGQDNPVGLFGYLVLLNTGLAWVARQKGWASLLIAALALTTFYQWSWVFTFLGPHNVPVAVGVFLTFPVLAYLLLTVGGLGRRDPGPQSIPALKLFRTLAALSAILPYLAVFYLIVPPFGEQFLWLFGLLFLLDAGLMAVAVGLNQEDLHALGGMCSVTVTLLWLGVSYSSAAWPIILPLICVFVLFYLLAPVVAGWMGRAFVGNARYAVYAAPVLLISFSMLALWEPARTDPGLLFGVLGGLMLAIGVVALYVRRAGLQVGSIASAVVVLLTWETVAWGAPWPSVAVVAAMVVAVFGSVWWWAAARRGVTGSAVAGSMVAAIVGAQVVAIGATIIPGAPALWVLASAAVLLTCALLFTAWRTAWTGLAPAALIPAFAAPVYWVLSAHTGRDWGGALLFGGLIYAVFISYPVTLGRRAGSSLSPYLAGSLANVPFFLIAYWALEQGGYDPYIGALPLAQAIVMAGLLVLLLRLEAPGCRTPGRLALVSATALAGLTLAIPLQLEHEWLTIGWALEGAALAWLFTRIPHRGLLWWSAALMAAVFVRLALNPAVFSYAPRGEMRIVNWYLYTYLVSSGAFLAVGKLLWMTEDRLTDQLPVRVSRLGPSATAVLLFILLNIEIADFYSVGEYITFTLDATVAQNLTYTLGWGVFGVAGLVVGIIARSHGARVAALVLLVATIFKCFLYDLGRLTGLYRVGSFVGLAVCLALVAIILQKYVLVRPAGDSS